MRSSGSGSEFILRQIKNINRLPGTETNEYYSIHLQKEFANTATLAAFHYTTLQLEL